MKNKTILSVAAAALTAVAALIAHGAAFISVQGQYIDGSASTNVIVAGTNVAVSTVPALTTNFFNLPNVANNTNEWPLIAFPPAFNPTPFRYVGMYANFTNIMTNSLIFRFAGSPDYSHWVSNVFWFAVSNNAANVTVPMWTNLDTLGFPFFALQQIENLGATNATGVQLIVVPKATSP